MKKFKDVSLQELPPHIADVLRTLIPEDAEVTDYFSTQDLASVKAIINKKSNNADGVKDNCTPIGCSDCKDCPIEKSEQLNLTGVLQTIGTAMESLAHIVHIDGSIAKNEQVKAEYALHNICAAADYALEVLDFSCNDKGGK